MIFKSGYSVKGSYSGLMALYFFSHAFSFAFPLMPIILRERGHFSANTTLLIISTAFLGSGLFNLYIGRLIDAGKGRILIIAAVVVNMTGIVGMMVAQKNIILSLLSVVLFLLGLSALNIFGSVILEASVAEDKLPKASSVFYGAGSLGFGVSAVIAHFLFQSHLILLIVLDAVSTALYGIYLLPIYRNRQKKVNPQRLPKVTINLRLSSLLLCHSLLFIAIVCHLSVVPLLYESMDLSSYKYTTVMFGTNNIIVVLICFVFAQKVTKVPENVRLVVGVLALALGSLLIPGIRTQIENFFVTCLWSIGESLLYPVIAATIYRHFGENHKGLAASSKNLTLRFAFVVSPLIGIALQGHWHYFGFLYGSLPIAAFALYLIHKLLPKPGPSQQESYLPRYITSYFSRNAK